MNDKTTLRTYVAKTDAHKIFEGMLKDGNPPDDWDAFCKAAFRTGRSFRTLESLPATAKGVAIIEIMDETEQQSINFKADVQRSWLLRVGAEPGKASLLVYAVRRRPSALAYRGWLGQDTPP